MSEFLSKMHSRYKSATETPSPKQIQEFITDHGESHMTSSDLWLLMPQEVISNFTSNKGRLKQDKVRKFLKSVDILLDTYKPNDILKINTDCIKKDGKIDEAKFKYFLENDNVN